MIEISIPGWGDLKLNHLVLDYNGTLAVDGELIRGVGETLTKLSSNLTIHVVTADTFGKAVDSLDGIPCALTVLPPGAQDAAKRDFVQSLGVDSVMAVGNGRNDRLMLKEAALGVAVILREGASAETLQAADIVCKDITDALELVLHPMRLMATLRS